MFLNSVIIVLREVLEASLLISIFAALSSVMGISRRWTGWALGFGVVGAIVYSFGINVVSDWFEGVGQEVTNAVLQVLIYLLLLLFSFLGLRRSSVHGLPGKMTVPVMAAAVALAVTREGFEVLVYVYGFSSAMPQLATILAGAAIGASIGISIGILFYYLVSSLAYRYALILGTGGLVLVGAGMISQAVLLLIQADWLPSQLPLWDSSSWIPESTVTGQLLYALIGYEATPSPIQASFYFGGLFLLLIVAVLARGTGRRSG